jgi:hypothetical protein
MLKLPSRCLTTNALHACLKYRVEKDARPRLEKFSNFFMRKYETHGEKMLDLFLGLNHAQNIELGTNKALKLLAINA